MTVRTEFGCSNRYRRSGTDYTKGTGADVVGYDLSQQMLNVGIGESEKAGLQDKIQMIKGDAEHMPFKDNEFDAITAAFGVRNFENLKKDLLK